MNTKENLIKEKRDRIEKMLVNGNFKQEINENTENQTLSTT